MDEADCALLAYSHGDFIDGDPDDCRFTDDPLPFDDVARIDRVRLAAALDESRTPIERTGGTFTGRDLRFAFFMSTRGAPFATSWEILYDPDDLYPRTATDIGSFTPIPEQDGWWFVCCADSAASPTTKRTGRICSTCPVRVDCLAYSLEMAAEDGVWGGVSAAERRALLAARQTLASGQVSGAV